ncbi:type II secretion system protein GspL [Corallincola holothuriorum]|uniref:Type II secretion system protein L n=2 Tax=Corallincola TaxID=1775176 RepID=A0A368NNA6_9GAMM|nr:type II secretion system protein GspL [Corallincola holothuriorum]TAA46076.1 type II secretion system protein GspL [Corallincola spongiicola]
MGCDPPPIGRNPVNEQLVIRLGHEHDAPVHWLVWSYSSSEVIASGTLAGVEQLETLHERVGGRKPVVLVPSSEVGLHNVPLPPKAGRAVIKALPFMLEEQLTQDVDSLHFALGERKDNVQQVMVVSRLKMAQWLDWLREANFEPQRLLPDLLALPWQEDGWTALDMEQQLLLRTDEFAGIVVEHDNAELYLQSMIAAREESEEPQLLNSYQPWIFADIDGLQIERQPEELPMQLLAEHLPSHKWNLLQGDFEAKREVDTRWLPWRKVAIVVGVCLLLNMVLDGLQLLRLSNQTALAKEQTLSVFKVVFPEVKASSVSKARSIMKQKLGELGGSVSTDLSLFSMLSQLEKPFSDVANMSLASLKFDSRRRELRIQAEGKAFADFEKFKAAAPDSFDIEIGSLNNQDGKVTGSVTIRGKQ